MEIQHIHTFKGRNIYSHKPVIKAFVDLGELYDTPTNKIPMFNERLLRLLPGLNKHCCSLGYEGGFVERLIEGTYLAHVTEHIVLELQAVTGYNVHYGQSRSTDRPSVYRIIFEYVNEKLAIECLVASVDIVNTLIAGEMPDMGRITSYLSRVAGETGLGTTTAAIYEEARKRGIPVTCLEDSSVLQLGTGKYTRLVEASLTDRSSCIAVDVACNKHLTKKILSEAGIPVPPGDVAYTPRSARAIADCIGYPLVVKPYDANQGKGVSLNITQSADIEKAFKLATEYSHAAIVEKHIPGRDYRLLVVGGKMVAAAERRPPFVMGDGVSTIKELIDKENKNPLRGSDHEKPLTYIKLDDMARETLARAGYNENSVPAAGEKVYVRINGNLSTGGTARDCTDEVHPYNAELAVKAASLLDLDIAGIDITCMDISKPLTPDNGAVIEVNAAPGLRMHMYPTEGRPRNVAGDILDMLYPEGQPFSVPIISVTGTNGKTTVTRMIAYTLGLGGIVVGMTSTSGIYIGGECILKGDNTGAISASMVLKDKRVEAAVLETARGGIIKRGLGYDLADVGVITNISDDHLGSDGINTLEELAKVKALVVEAVKPDGAAVLNADDKMTPWIMQRIRCRKILFSLDYGNPLIQKEIKEGGRVLYVRDGSIFTADKNNEIHIARIGEIPITYNGRAVCNIENSLAAAAALIGAGVDIDLVRKGIVGFMPDVASNPGRFNMFDMGDFAVMLDYGHNLAGYRAVADMIRCFDSSVYTGVIGMPGDRKDESIYQVGKLCGRCFSKLYIKEDSDLRGRNAGEVADILRKGALDGGMHPDNIVVIRKETLALETAIKEAVPGELIVMFYEKLEPALEIIDKYKGAQCRKEAGVRPGDRAKTTTGPKHTATG